MNDGQAVLPLLQQVPIDDGRASLQKCRTRCVSEPSVRGVKRGVQRERLGSLLIAPQLVDIMASELRDFQLVPAHGSEAAPPGNNAVG